MYYSFIARSSVFYPRPVFIKGKYITDIVVPSVYQHIGEDGYATFPHLAYFCPYCGDIWARIGDGKYWTCHIQRCEHHDNTSPTVYDPSTTPGSLLVGWLGKLRYPPLLECMPEILLKRELFLHFKHGDKYGIFSQVNPEV